MTAFRSASNWRQPSAGLLRQLSYTNRRLAAPLVALPGANEVTRF